MIINKDVKSLINKYIELVSLRKINPLIIDIEIYNNLDYLPEYRRIKESIIIDYNNELEYWMYLASPLLKEYLLTLNIQYNER